MPESIAFSPSQNNNSFGIGQSKFEPYSPANKSILVIGGDHPYEQWWGTNGKNGMAQMFFDLGIQPYIAINADESSVDPTSGRGGTLNKRSSGMMDQYKAVELEGRGVEFVSHGARHIHFWELANTGIRVWYTGGEATPNVNISTTTLTLNTAVTGNTAFTLASYATLTSLRTAIQAVAGWNCELATELTGNEPASSLSPLRAARSVASLGSADPTNSNQRFSIGAGLYIRYTGNAYRDVAITLNSGSNFLNLFLDGARAIATTTNATIATVASAINALNIAGLTVLMIDNGYNAQTIGGSTTLNPGQKTRETYGFGDEDASALIRIDNTRSVTGYGVWACSGLGWDYAVRRNVLSVKERAAQYGVTVNSFAQSGGRLRSWMVDPIKNEHVQWRGNRNTASDRLVSGSPHPLPFNLSPGFTGHFTSRTLGSELPYGEEDVKAIIDAMGDSPGFIVNWLNHLLIPTPNDPSPYSGINVHSDALYSSSADQQEGPFWRELKYAAAARDAGKISILPPTKAEYARSSLKGPDNLVFNPRFRNGRSGNLLGITTAELGASGVAVPGFTLDTPSSDYSSVTVDSERAIKIVTNGAITTGKTPILCTVFLEPGKTYRIGCTLDLSQWGSGNKANWVIYPLNDSLGELIAFGDSSISDSVRYGPAYEAASFRLTVPPVSRLGLPAQIITQAGPFTFGGTDSVKVRIDGLAASAAISLAGLTTARQVAAALNTGIESDAVYGPLGQYKNLATVENNRVVLRAPVYTGPDDVSYMEMTNSVGTPLAALFGAGFTAARTSSKLHGPIDASYFGYRIGIVLGATSGSQTIRILNPFCVEIKG